MGKIQCEDILCDKWRQSQLIWINERDHVYLVCFADVFGFPKCLFFLYQSIGKTPRERLNYLFSCESQFLCAWFPCFTSKEHTLSLCLDFSSLLPFWPMPKSESNWIIRSRQKVFSCRTVAEQLRLYLVFQNILQHFYENVSWCLFILLDISWHKLNDNPVHK